MDGFMFNLTSRLASDWVTKTCDVRVALGHKVTDNHKQAFRESDGPVPAGWQADGRAARNGTAAFQVAREGRNVIDTQILAATMISRIARSAITKGQRLPIWRTFSGIAILVRHYSDFENSNRLLFRQRKHQILSMMKTLN